MSKTQISNSYFAGAKAGAFAGVPAGIAYAIYGSFFLHFSFESFLVEFITNAVDFVLLGVLYSFVYVWLYNKLPGKSSVIKAEVLILLPGAIGGPITYLVIRTFDLISLVSFLPILILFGFLLGTFYSRLAKINSPRLTA